MSNNTTKHIYESHVKTKYHKLELSDSGKHLAFVVDTDSTKAYERNKELYTWNQKNDLKLILDRKSSPDGYQVSSDGQINFSDDETKLYFGLALPEIYQDTLLLKDEIVDVEVWTYDEPRLYTIQEMQLNNDRKKSFKSVYHINDEKVIQIATKEFPNSITSENGNNKYALISNPEPYQLSSQWTALFSKHDLAVRNINNGEFKSIIKGNPSAAKIKPRWKLRIWL